MKGLLSKRQLRTQLIAMIINISTLSCLNFICFDEGQVTLETSAPYTTYGDDNKISTLSFVNYSCFDERLTLETSATYTTCSNHNISTLNSLNSSCYDEGLMF